MLGLGSRARAARPVKRNNATRCCECEAHVCRACAARTRDWPAWAAWRPAAACRLLLSRPHARPHPARRRLSLSLAR
ncbi:hypothetical protein GUJ93_ZPchr0003g17918 [Zizania palustris]|uniref:Uncharacterized protein n=1 Tax=Zizania palustris TaxID=103762 RepID=A0A8J5VJW7_ZIZPA|nr:hypothetical protein GUJ93_ZPchr0003g17918 [Zizania palustris]